MKLIRNNQNQSKSNNESKNIIKTNADFVAGDGGSRGVNNVNLEDVRNMSKQQINKDDKNELLSQYFS